MNSRHHTSMLLRTAAVGLCGVWTSFAAQAQVASTTDVRPGSRIAFTDDAYMGIGSPAASRAVIAPARGGAAAEAAKGTEQTMAKAVREAVAADNAAAPAGTVIEWLVKPEDQDLQTLLVRWAAAADWQLSWEATKPYPVKFNATLHGSFVEAARDALLPYTRGSDPIKGCIYDNNVLRVVPKPTVCKLK